MLPALLAEAVRRFGERTAFVAGPWQLSFADLDRLSDEVAVGLARRGVRPGDVVALALPTAPEYPICYLAAAKLGAVTAGLNLRLGAEQLARLVDLVRPRVTVAVPGVLPGADEEVVPSRDGRDPLAGLRAGAAERSPPVPVPDPQRPVAIVFTSGTTGTPKGAVFAGRQLEAIRAVDAGTQWGAGGAHLLGTSLSHLGFMTKLPALLQTGRTTYLMAPWRAEDALRLTAELGLASLSGVPAQLALVLAQPLLGELDLSSLRQVLIGGGPATPALVRAARERLGVPVCTRYSCTEAGIGCGTHPSDPPGDAETTVGRPQPGVELAIRDGDDREVETGAVGEVLLRSAAVMTGYWNDPKATTAAFTPDGFVRTGDLGRLDEQGRLHLVGRTKEMYVRGGYNVFLFAVETVLAGHPAVREVAVVPRPDPVMGEVGVAVVVPRGRTPVLEELRTYARGALASYELPEDLRVVDALPLTAGDKVDRASLTRLVSDVRVS